MSELLIGKNVSVEVLLKIVKEYVANTDEDAVEERREILDMVEILEFNLQRRV